MKTLNKRSIAKSLAFASLLILATACGHEEKQTGKDDGTGTIMDDGTTNKHRGGDTTINTLRVDSVR